MTPSSPDQIMTAALRGDAPGQTLLSERADGHSSTADLAWWLRDPQTEPPADLAALDLIDDGHSLDVGCATGRHLDALRERGLTGEGIDTCAHAIALARANGHTCHHADIWHYQPARPYDTVLALGGNLGIAGNLPWLEPFLARLRDLLTPAGSLIVTSVDWRHTTQTNPRHAAHAARQRAASRYPGEVDLRLRLGEQASSWFPWVWVDPDTLTDIAARLGLHPATTLSWGPKYAVQLRRKTPQ